VSWLLERRTRTQAGAALTLLCIVAAGCGKKPDLSRSPAVGEWFIPRKDTSKPVPAGFSPAFLVLKGDGTSYVYRRGKKPFVHRTWSQEGRTLTFKSDAGADKVLPAWSVGFSNAMMDRSMRSVGTLATDSSTLMLVSTSNPGSPKERTTTVIYHRWKGIYK
jgi:hypothetical protein